MKKHLPFYLLLALVLFPLFSFSQFRISAELRPRFEADNGARRPLPDTLETSYFVSQRTRLRLDYEHQKYELRLSIQDVQYWGSGEVFTPTGMFSSSSGLGIHEAWFSLKMGGHSRLTIGRQVLKIDGQRLLATRNRNQYGISYDAVKYAFARDGWQLNLLLSYNQNNLQIMNGRFIIDKEFYGRRNLIKSQNFLYLKKQFSDDFSASLLGIVSGYQHDSITSLIYLTATYGAWWKYDNGRFDISGEAYIQNGKAQNGNDVMAYMASVHPGVKIGKMRLGIGGDYISGDNAEKGDYGTKERTFNLMYGAVFKYYGHMNYFSYMKSTTANGGLIDIYPNIRIPVNEKHSLTAFYHKFYLANPVLVKNEVIDDTDLGSEVDLVYTYKILKSLVLQAGASYYFTSGTLEKIKGVDGGDIRPPVYAWTMITFTPTLFQTR